MTSYEIEAIASTQARIYYKPEEVTTPDIVIESVFLLIMAVLAVQLTRSGLSDEDLTSLDLLPVWVVQEMQSVGWNITILEAYTQNWKLEGYQ